MISYPKNVTEFKKLRSTLLKGRLSENNKVLAQSYITHWQVVTGSYNLRVLVKISGKSQKTISNELGIKPRQLNEMVYGLNGLSLHKTKLATYFNVEESLFNDHRQSKVKVA